MDILKELYRLVEAAETNKIQIRTIGGLAVHVHNKKNHPLFIREYGDLDFVVAKKQRREFESFMPTVGYSPHKQFNILNGDIRQIYYHDESEMKIDIFVGDFEMCHKIPLENRLIADPLTIPLAELFLSKIQIIDLNQKDAMDIASLLLNVETGNHDKDTINLNIIAELCGNDWGLYKTTSINLEKVREIVNKTSLSNDEKDLISKRIQEILKTFESMPKSLAWTLRDRVGTRVKWYIEVEEVGR
ncbi:MAG: nucleotidyltransferase family protein [Anaerolineales bacterium]|nr:nucleotidyltransferase family protein [Anaerolineales bacterium]